MQFIRVIAMLVLLLSAAAKAQSMATAPSESMVAMPRPGKPSAKLCDPDATPEARALMASLVGSFGKGTLSGVYSGEDAGLVEGLTGKTPAVLGGDLMDFTPSRLSRGAKPGRWWID